MDGITKRWVDGPMASDADWDAIESVLVAKGWLSLNRNVSRILVAEDSAGKMVAFNVLQLVPYAGPLHLNRDWRGTGLAEEMNDEMVEYMVESQVRGWLVVAESKFIQDYCEKIGMARVASPVYVKVGMEKGNGG
jgi:hypothetical protein